VIGIFESIEVIEIIDDVENLDNLENLDFQPFAWLLLPFFQKNRVCA